MRYIVTVKEQEYAIEVGEGHVLVDGQRFDVDFQQLSNGMVSLLLNNRSLEAVVEERNKLWEVLVSGELYSVVVQDERTYRLAQARAKVGATTGESVISAPMPGLIVAVPVRVGDLVEEGQQVIILESMKMENELRAPRAGKILRVNAEAGASVEKDEALVIIGDPEQAVTD